MVNINIQKKDLWLISAIFVFLVGVGFVVAYNSGWTGGTPPIMGHSPDELEGVCLSDGTNCLTNTRDNCVYVESEVGTTGYYEISLIINGKNICETPHGCSFIFYKIKDDTQVIDMDNEMHRYIQDENGNYREELGDGISGVNGDGSNTLMRNYGQCDIYDDKTDSSESFIASKDTFVMRDETSDQIVCKLSICSRNFF